MLKVLIWMCMKLLLNTYSILMHHLINKSQGRQRKVFAWGVQQFDPKTHMCVAKAAYPPADGLCHFLKLCSQHNVTSGTNTLVRRLMAIPKLMQLYYKCMQSVITHSLVEILDFFLNCRNAVRPTCFLCF